MQSMGGYEGQGYLWEWEHVGRRSLSPLASPAGRDNDPGQERSLPPSHSLPFFFLIFSPFSSTFPFPPILSLLLLLPPFLSIEEGRWEGMDINGKIKHFCAHFICEGAR